MCAQLAAIARRFAADATAAADASKRAAGLLEIAAESAAQWARAVDAAAQGAQALTSDAAAAAAAAVAAVASAPKIEIAALPLVAEAPPQVAGAAAVASAKRAAAALADAAESDATRASSAAAPRNARAAAAADSAPATFAEGRAEIDAAAASSVAPQRPLAGIWDSVRRSPAALDDAVLPSLSAAACVPRRTRLGSATPANRRTVSWAPETAAASVCRTDAQLALTNGAPEAQTAQVQLLAARSTADEPALASEPLAKLASAPTQEPPTEIQISVQGEAPALAQSQLVVQSESRSFEPAGPARGSEPPALAPPQEPPAESQVSSLEKTSALLAQRQLAAESQRAAPADGPAHKSETLDERTGPAQSLPPDSGASGLATNPAFDGLAAADCPDQYLQNKLVALLERKSGKSVSESHFVFSTKEQGRGFQGQLKLTRWLGGNVFVSCVCDSQETALREVAQNAIDEFERLLPSPKQQLAGQSDRFGFLPSLPDQHWSPSVTPLVLQAANWEWNPNGSYSWFGQAGSWESQNANAQLAQPAQFAQPAYSAQPVHPNGRSASRDKITSKQRKPWQDLTSQGFPPPYLVVTSGHLAGYKVHVGDLPGRRFADLKWWARGVLENASCPVPDDFGPSMPLTKKGTGQLLLTFASMEHAQRARLALDGQPTEDRCSNARYWVPTNYNAWDSDPRFRHASWEHGAA